MIHAKNFEKGIKGRGTICDVPEFDIINNLHPDSMHNVYLGVCRQLGNLWFAPINHDEEFYFGHLLPEIDAALLSYKPKNFGKEILESS